MVVDINPDLSSSCKEEKEKKKRNLKLVVSMSFGCSSVSRVNELDRANEKEETAVTLHSFFSSLLRYSRSTFYFMQVVAECY